MQESGDNYVNADFMLPRDGTLARRRVIERNSDVNDNPIGRANYNPILYSRHYLVEFGYFEVI